MLPYKNCEIESDNILTRVTLFKNWPDHELHDLCLRSFVENYSASQIIYEEGDISRFLCIVISGRIEISYLRENGEHVLFSILDEMDIFGEIGFFDGRPRNEMAIAKSDCRILLIPKTALIEIIKNISFEAWLDIVQYLCLKQRKMAKDITENSIFSSKQRLASKLLELSGKSSQPGKIFLTKEDLASMLGLSRVTIGKLLMNFEKEKAIINKRSCVEITDKKILAAHMENDNEN